METLKQSATPLNTAFFCQNNMNKIQNTMRSNFKNESGISIDRQDERDLFALMRAVFIMFEINPYENVDDQVNKLNEIVVNKALIQIRTGVSQFMTYVRDMDKPIMPPATPENTSIYGTRLPDLKF